MPSQAAPYHRKRGQSATQTCHSTDVSPVPRPSSPLHFLIMPFAALRNIFCCCSGGKGEESPLYDERSHLIPESNDPPALVYSSVVLIDRKKIEERLGHIVRAKEGKMVNVASQIPFNLHNQVIPEQPQHSRSASGSVEPQEDDPYAPSTISDFYANRDSARYRRRGPFGTSNYGYHEPTTRSSSVAGDDEAGPSPRSRAPSIIIEQPKPTPILNVRLVGYTDTRARGRARERGSAPSGLPGPHPPVATEATEGSSGAEGAASPTEENPSTPKPRVTIPTDFKLPDAGAIIMSWGD
ncbi:unnamed protein product [Cyclocybe aegerita]|uniref:Uncharacterized protein n=1 Tax=Cyclocybe aegerita TaxID=1973307 RepID=A0A8S0VU93_CYCAE|nr:unnamed protein product [Cyclocybe aegerita]